MNFKNKRESKKHKKFDIFVGNVVFKAARFSETFGFILNKIDNASEEICNNVNYRLKMQHKLEGAPWRPAYNIDYLCLLNDCKKSNLKSSINCYFNKGHKNDNKTVPFFKVIKLPEVLFIVLGWRLVKIKSHTKIQFLKNAKSQLQQQIEKINAGNNKATNPRRQKSKKSTIHHGFARLNCKKQRKKKYILCFENNRYM